MNPDNITSMKIPFLALAVLASSLSQAQYYYNDIVSTLETSRQMQTWKDARVRTISSTGYDANGVKATDFAEVRELRDSYRTLRVSTRNGSDHSAYYNRYDENGRLVNSTDTSFAEVKNSTTYTYDAAGRITQVKTVVSDSTGGFDKTEVHDWYYNAAGKPEKMWRIVNKTDSIEIRFFPDEKGNPGDEVLYKWGVESSRYYYYFDEEGRVTDIARFNDKVKKIMPDMMFTYDEKGNLLQKVTTTGNDNLGKMTWVGYIIWRYIYNDKGLKTKEALFDKDQQLTGKIEYSYTFYQ